jgi:dipeptidyl aminopeptidase/acylaminoacyl peptidase
MKRALLNALLVSALLVPGGRALADLPQIIDRAVLFGDPEYSGAQLSPDGKFISFLKPLDGTKNVWVKRLNDPFEKAWPVTADTRRPVQNYFWSNDSRYVLWVQDQGGDENFNVWAVDPAQPPAAGAKAPPARNLTEAKGVRAYIYAVPRSAPGTLYVGLNDRDAAWHDLYRLDIASGARTLLHKNTGRITGWIFDTTDQLRLASRSTAAGDQELLRVDGEALVKIAGCGVLEECAAIQFDLDGKRVYQHTNAGAAPSDLTRLVLLDVATGKETAVESDPLKRVDLGAAVFSEWTDKLLFTVYTDERVRRVFKDKAIEADFKVVQARFPGRDVNFGSSSSDERRWIVSTTADVEPGEVFLYDRQDRSMKSLYRIREQLPRQQLAPMQAIRFRSSDGLEIPAYLTLPKGVPAKGLPAVIFPHGGPWARDTWGYHTFAQFLANRGYAVLQPNFRGSTGYGRKFLDAGNKQWGDKMQDDLTWGVKYLVDQGIADGKRVAIMGGSYGGYATLAGVAFTPDVYAAGVSIVGPSNLLTLLGTIPPYWEAGRIVFHTRMGDPNNPEGKAQLTRQSPLSAAARIKVPLMVIQGANDPRVKKAESDQIVVALRDRGFPVEYLVAPDEGHGFVRPVNNMAAYAAAEKFLARHVGGRYQASMPEDVAARLGVLTVDPKSVVITPGAPEGAPASPAPPAPK